ncbi:MAG: DUF4249 domain-containing protein [Chitinophaga sp.]|uniref:DUF4249 domain-containing protein n=1 Tax=Chitinophaga sp. TaxID=1869181 RepID=UPI001B173B53|nr:DUF4249 domain-containing protein [Chitinophaga sp.]MBO9729492.1 DUF4249 domain-containing protein [Chitinophaga sp.]
MRRQYFFVGTVLLVMLLNACTKRVEIQMPYEGDKIVLNTLIQPDSVIYVRVTRSIPSNMLDDSGYKDIPGSAVIITANGVTLPAPQVQVIKGLSYFVSTEKAVRGQQYTVQVQAPGLTAVTATDTLPAAPLAKNASAQRNSNRVLFTLKDDPAPGNYYRIRIYITNENGGQGTYLLFGLDPAFNNNLVDFFTKSSYNSLVMNDERFNGKDVNFVLQTVDPIPGPSQVTVEVSVLTRATYDYFRTMTAQKENGNMAVRNPVRVYTNVTNGYGIVGGINTQKLTFKVE